jgi:hypothetical protein
MTGPRTTSVEDKKAALDAVLQTTSFLRAGQLRNFLRFICEMEIAGRAAEITEYLIGVEALGRPPGYSTAEDSIVRRRAIDLRDKLEEVYRHELSSATIRIELPKGRYVPHFVAVDSSPSAPPVAPPIENAPLTPSSSPAPRVAPVPTFALGFVAGTLATAAAFTAYLWRPAPPVAPAPEPQGIVYEGEAVGNVLSGSTTTGDCPPCSGGHRVRNIGNTPANYVDINGVRVATDGNYTLKIDYLLQGARAFFVSVNGAPAVEVPLKGDNWLALSSESITVALKAGTNSIRFSNDHAYAPDLDRIVVR